jgi:hypothetical protein
MSCKNIIGIIGSLLEYEIEVVDINDQPIDLTIYPQIKMQIRKKVGSDIIFEASLGNGFSFVDGKLVISKAIEQNYQKITQGPDNSINVSVIPIKAGMYKYDIDFISSDGTRTFESPLSILIKDQITV